METFFRSRPAEAEAITVHEVTTTFQSRSRFAIGVMTPYLLGSNAIKFSAAPISRSTNRTPRQIDVLRRQDELSRWHIVSPEHRDGCSGGMSEQIQY